jgi:hypothetical protein
MDREGFEIRIISDITVVDLRDGEKPSKIWTVTGPESTNGHRTQPDSEAVAAQRPRLTPQSPLHATTHRDSVTPHLLCDVNYSVELIL